MHAVTSQLVVFLPCNCLHLRRQQFPPNFPSFLITPLPLVSCKTFLCHIFVFCICLLTVMDIIIIVVIIDLMNLTIIIIIIINILIVAILPSSV